MVEITRIRHWRLRAEELRTAASNLKDRGARTGFLQAAETYERLAEAAEKTRRIRLSSPRPLKARVSARAAAPRPRTAGK